MPKNPPPPAYDDLYELIHAIEDYADKATAGGLTVQEWANVMRSIQNKARMALGLLDRMNPEERGALYPTD